MNDKLKRLIATLVAGVGLFAFAACGTDGNGTDTDTDADKSDIIDNDGKDDDKKDPDTKPVIPTVPKGAVQITEAAGDLESAYAIWDKVEGAMGYNVYYKIDGGEFVKLDAPLVREYKNYCRADAVGLKAGKYILKVVPTGGADYAEDTGKAGTATEITVLAHERTGYAFVNGTSSGAYNDDGTLKQNANVLYITDANKHSVKMTVAGIECVGLQAILTAYKKETKPLAVRFIGNIGKLEIANSDAGNFLVKENGAPVTVEGIGNDATANGWGLRAVRASNVEIRNLGFMNTVGEGIDNVGLENENDHIWVHNCDMFYGGAGGDSDQAKGDGALDTKLSTYVTHSYNHFWDSGKSNLQGMKSEKTTNYITYHHNWYDHSDSRHPRIRTCTVHIYNNYFDGNAKYGVGVTMGASAFVENNYFRSTATMKPMLSSNQGTDALGEGTFSGESGGMIKAYGNVFVGNYKLITQNDTADKTNLDCYLATSRNETVPSEYKTKSGGTTYNNFDTASGFYEYEVETPEAAKERIERYAGRIGGGDFKWEFDDATEDSNYSIITALKSALVAYASDLVKVGGEAVSGGTTSGDATGGEEGGDVTTVDGEIKFIPTSSGSGFTVEGTAKSHSAIEIDGVSIAKGTALKMNSSGSVSFTTEKDMTLSLYLMNENTIKVDEQIKTPAQSGNCYMITMTLKAGDHVIKQGSGENALYLIKLVPVT